MDGHHGRSHEGERSVQPASVAPRPSPFASALAPGGQAAAVLALQRLAGNRATRRALHRQPQFRQLQRQVVPSRLELAGDPFKPREFPGHGFWLLADQRTMPTVQEGVDAAIRWRPGLAAVLATATPRRYELPLDAPYYVWRDSAGRAVLRMQLRHSGYDYEGGNERATYGVYVFVPDGVGATLRGWGQATGGPSGTPAAVRPSVTSGPADPLLDLYMQRFPSGSGPSTTRMTQEMRIRLALELADKTLLGSIADAANEAIRDPLFWGTTILLIGVYVGLWLTPDPTLITKLLAAGLTATLIALFTWNDIIGFARAWMRLTEQAAVATSEAELREAGDTFMQTGGRVAFDVLLMIAMWGMGRAARPSLRAARTRIATEARVQAETRVREAREAPGGGAQQRGTGAEATRVADAEAAAGGGSASPTQVLQALARALPETARRGLAVLRGRRGSGGTPTPQGDRAVLEVLRGRQRGGMDITRWLGEQGLTPAERAGAQQAVANAEAAALRARLIEADALRGNASVSARVRAELRTTVLDFARALLRAGRVRLRQLVANRDVRALVGELGEALAEHLVRTGPEAGALGQRGTVVSNLELARRIGDGTVSSYVAAERAAGRPVDVGRLRQGPDGVYESLGQVDVMLAERLPDGRLRPQMLEEVKTGATDQPSAAQTQVTNAQQVLADIGAGASTARVMERPTPNSVGADVTRHFDLSQPAPTVRTRGLAGRGFNESLGVDRPSLEAVARQLIAEGLPAGEPTTPVHVPTREREREPVPAR